MTSATHQHKSEPGHGGGMGAEKTADAMQQGLAALMSIPQRLMQANIEAVGDGMTFMMRRMKAQAAIMSSFGKLTNGGGLADMQRHVIETMTQEIADEAQELGTMARRRVDALTRTVGVDGSGTSSSQMS